MLESRADQRLQVRSLDVSRNLPLQPLPGVARTFDKLHRIRQFIHHGDTEAPRSRSQRTFLTIPPRVRTETLKFRTSPTRLPVIFKYVRSCASWTGRMCSTRSEER